MPQKAADLTTVVKLLQALAVLAKPSSALAQRLILLAILLMTSGLRLPESIITLQHGSVTAAVHPHNRLLTLASVTPSGLKDDKSHAIVNPRQRPMVYPTTWHDLLMNVWGCRLTEEQATHLDTTVRSLLHASGISDVRQLRRLAATSTWQAATEEPEQQALHLVRTILGHRDNSESTFRYVPSRSNSHTNRRLASATAAAPAALTLPATGDTTAASAHNLTPTATATAAAPAGSRALTRRR
jgi:hypothetical protein